MSAKIIDGKAIAADLRAKVAAETRRLTAAHGLMPGLAVVLVGDNAASKTYVASKARALVETGMRPFDHYLPADTSEAELLGADRKTQRRSGGERHFGAAAVAAADQYRARCRQRRAGQGRRRLSPDQFRAPGGKTADACSMHADRLHQARQFGASVARRARRAGGRPLQYRRQSAGAACCSPRTRP